MERRKLLGLIGLALVGVIAVITIVVLVIPNESSSSSSALASPCSSAGGFHDLIIGNKTVLRYKVLQKSEDDLYTFEEAKEACKKVEADLWEVNGQSEWAALSARLAAAHQTSVWLNGKGAQDCPGGRVATCYTERALRGYGLLVEWPSAASATVPRGPRAGDYSRLIGGSDDDCISVQHSGSGSGSGSNRPLVWKRTPCQSNYYAPCVKRDCPVKETK